jgi:hypothetical protein
MATLSKHGTELCRYFSTRYYGLVSVRSDGTVLRRTPHSNGWKLYRRKKPDIPLADWCEAHRRRYEESPAWTKKHIQVPTCEELEDMARDYQCETVTGDPVDIDGYGADGAPSWIVALGMV